ncbi:MAG: hypothetical protein PVG22_09620 [Chromatiales bacterium]|jgi:hypothetical protein
MKQHSPRHIFYLSLLITIAAVTGGLTWVLSNPVESETTAANPTTELAPQAPITQPNASSNDSALASLQRRLDDLTVAVQRTQDQLGKQSQALDQTKQNYLTLQAESMHTMDIDEGMNIEQEDIHIQRERDRALAEQIYTEQLALLESDLATQSRDIHWSTQIEDDFSRAFDEHLQSYSLDNILCGDKTCRLDVTMYMDNEATEIDPQSGLQQIINGDVGWTGQSLYRMNMETGEVTVYLLRNGVEMPTADNEF